MEIVLDCSESSQRRWKVTSLSPLTQGPLGAETFSGEEIVQLRDAGSLTDDGEQLIGTICTVNEFTTRLDEDTRNVLVIEAKTDLDPERVTNFLKSKLHDFAMWEAIRKSESVAVNFH